MFLFRQAVSLISLFERPENQITVVKQATIFLEHLKDWEFEEFLCIRIYLLEKLNPFRNQVEDDFLKDFIDEGPGLTNGNHRWWDNGDMWFSTTCHREMRSYWIEGCLSRSLTELKAMFVASTPEDRLDAIGYESWPRVGLSQALKEMAEHPSRTRSSWRLEIDGDTAFHDDIKACNAGWFWAMRSREQSRHPNPYNKEFDTLRRIGYSIWGHERLTSLGILSRRTDDVVGGRKELVCERPSVGKQVAMQVNYGKRKEFTLRSGDGQKASGDHFDQKPLTRMVVTS